MRTQQNTETSQNRTKSLSSRHFSSEGGGAADVQVEHTFEHTFLIPTAVNTSDIT